MAILSACDINSLSTAAKCFDCLSATEKRALQVYFLAQALKSYGGADLTSSLVRNKAVACLACEPDFRLDSFMTAVYQKGAAFAGASVDLTIAQLRAKVSCHPCGQTKLDRASLVYLNCSLALLGH